MKQKHPTIGLEMLCGLFGKTRQAYYKANKRQKIRQGEDHLMIKKLRKLREEMPGVGTRKLQHLIVSYPKKHSIKMGRDKMHELLRKEDMLIRFRRRRTRTTYSDHSYVRHKNLTKNLEVTAVDQLYVADITYIPVGKYFVYLNLITDAYSRKIVGWHLHDSLHAEGTIQALEMALQ